MALTWGSAPTKIIDAVTVAASSESSLSSEVDLDSCIGVVGISVACTFNASATDGAVLKVYPCYDGTNYADVPVEEAGVSLNDAGNSTEAHLYFIISCRKIKVAVENLDTAQSITGVNVWAHKQMYS